MKRRREHPARAHRWASWTAISPGAVSVFLAVLAGTIFTSGPASAQGFLGFCSAGSRALIPLTTGNSTQIYAAEFTADGIAMSPLGGPVDPLNAMAYRASDANVYAIGQPGGEYDGYVVRVGRNGSAQPLFALPANRPPGFNGGAFGSDGTFWFASSKQDPNGLWKADVDTGAVQRIEVNGGVGGSDITVSGAYVWGIDEQSRLHRVDPASGEVQLFPLIGADGRQADPQVLGGAFTFGNGDLGFVAQNIGTVYRVVPPSAGADVALVVSSWSIGHRALNGDATMCVSHGTDLAVEKAAPSAVGPGEPLTYTITVTNEGLWQSSGWTLTDQIPSGVKDPRLTSDSPGAACVIVGRTLSCTGGPLRFRQSATVTVQMDAPQTAVSVTNVAVVRPNESDPNTANNQSTATTVVSGGSTAACSAESPVLVSLTGPNTTQIYTTAFAADRVDMSPLGGPVDRVNAMAYRPWDGQVYAIGSPRSAYYGSLVRIDSTGATEVLFALPANGPPDFNASAFDADGTFWFADSNNDPTGLWKADVDVDGGAVERIELQGAVGGSDITASGPYLWGIDLNSQLRRVDPVSGEVRVFPVIGLDGVPLQGRLVVGGAFTFGNGDLGFVAQEIGMTYRVVPPAPGAGAAQIVSSRSIGLSAVHGDATGCASDGTDLAVEKSGPARVDPGASFTYIITVTNQGSAPSSGWTLTDEILDGLDNPAAGSASGAACTLEGRMLSCTGGPLEPGASATMTVDVTASPTAQSVLNVAVVRGNDADPDPLDNVAFVTTVVSSAAGFCEAGSRAVIARTGLFGTELYTADLTAEELEMSPFGDRVARLNAMAYNTWDGYTYAIGQPLGELAGQVVRIDPSGAVEALWELPTNQPPGFNGGAFDAQGTFWFASSNQDPRGLWRADLNTQSVQRIELNGDVGGSDITFSRGYLWSANENATLHRLDPVSGEVQVVPLVDADGRQLGGGVFGGAFTYSNGDLGFYGQFTGTVYRVALPAVGANAAVVVSSQSTGLVAPNGDATACVAATSPGPVD